MMNRRDFLKLAGAAATVAAQPSVVRHWAENKAVQAPMVPGNVVMMILSELGNVLAVGTGLASPARDGITDLDFADMDVIRTGHAETLVIQGHGDWAVRVPVGRPAGGFHMSTRALNHGDVISLLDVQVSV